MFTELESWLSKVGYVEIIGGSIYGTEGELWTVFFGTSEIRGVGNTCEDAYQDACMQAMKKFGAAFVEEL